MANENNQDLIKIVQETQKSNRINTIVGAVSALTATITSGILIWKSLKRDKTGSKVRLIRQKGRIDRVKLRHQAESDKMELRQKSEMARELLELDIIEREVKHEVELRELEVGLENKEEKEVILETDNFIGDLKGAGKDILKKGATEIKEKLNKLKDKIPLSEK